MREKRVRQLLGVLFLFVICGLFTTKKVDAASYGSKYQTGQTQNSITVSWQTPTYSYAKVTGYQVYIGSDYSSASAAMPVQLGATATSYTFTNLNPGTQYYVTVKYTYINSSGHTYTSTAASGYMGTLPGKVQGVMQERWWRYALSVNAAWTKQDGVTGYEYIIKDSKNRVISSSKNSYGAYANCKVQNNMLYTLVVRAFTDINGTRYYGQWSDTAYLFTQPELTKLSIKNGKLTVKWKKISGVTSYDVYISKNKNTGYKKVKTVNAKKAVVTVKKFKKAKFNKKKTYYAYIVARKKVGSRTYGSGVNYVSSISKGKFNSSLQYIAY